MKNKTHKTARDTRLRDAILELGASAEDEKETLARLVAQHPDLAADLRAAVIEIGLDRVREASSAPAPSPYPEDGVVEIARNAFEERLAEIEREREDPFHALGVADKRALARRLRIDAVILRKIQERLVTLETIPTRFLGELAEGLARSVDDVRAFLALPVAAPSGSYSAKSQPKAGEKASFTETIEASDLPAEDKAHLLEDVHR